MSLGKVSPLFSHTITNVTKTHAPLDIKVAKSSQSFFAILVKRLFGSSAPSLVSRAHIQATPPLHVDIIRQRRFKISSIIPKQITHKPQPATASHVKAAKGHVSQAPLKRRLPSAVFKQAADPVLPEDPKTRAASPTSIASTETEPQEEAVIPDAKLTPSVLLKQVPKSPTIEELRQENIQIRKDLAVLCGLDNDAFDTSYIKEIVQNVVEHQVNAQDLLDRFFMTEPHNHFGPSKRVSVRHIMKESQIEYLLKDVEQDLPRGKDYLELSKEARSLIFYKNLDRIELLLDTSLNIAKLKAFKTSEEALNSEPLNLLSKILSYKISDSLRAVITLIIDRFKNTFSSR